MKKVLLKILFAIAIITSVSISGYAANNQVKVNVDGKAVSFDVPPQIINERTMVPIRAIFESLGATVNWDDSTKTAHATDGNFNVSLTLYEKYIVVNNKKKEMDTSAIMINDRILAPVRYVAESFGCTVLWEDSSQIAHIFSPDSTSEFYPYSNVPSLTMQSGLVADSISADFDVDNLGSDIYTYVYYIPADKIINGETIKSILEGYIWSFVAQGWICDNSVVSTEPFIMVDVYCINGNDQALVTVDYWKSQSFHVVIKYIK